MNSTTVDLKYTLPDGKVITIPRAELDKLTDLYGDDALQVWLEDNDYLVNDTIEELTAKAKANRITGTIHQARAEKTEKTRKPREKKENPLKKAIISAICDGIEANIEKFDADKVHFVVTNDEKYINLTVNDMEFTINLVQHRKK